MHFRGGWHHPPLFLKGRISVDIERRNMAFGRILLFLAILWNSSIKTRFCDQRNWPIITCKIIVHGKERYEYMAPYPEVGLRQIVHLISTCRVSLNPGRRSPNIHWKSNIFTHSPRTSREPGCESTRRNQTKSILAMGQLRWSQNRVLMLDFQRIAKNNKIRPNAMCLRSILTEIQPFEKNGWWFHPPRKCIPWFLPPCSYQCCRGSSQCKCVHHWLKKARWKKPWHALPRWMTSSTVIFEGPYLGWYWT